jgi:phenylalanyl-tRNA synthetase alpha chain
MKLFYIKPTFSHRRRKDHVMKDKLASLRQTAEKDLQAASTSQELEALRIRYLGKKGELTAILKQMGSLSAEERPIMGALANDVRHRIEEMLASRIVEIERLELEKRLLQEDLDITLPSKRKPLGHKHPMNILLDEIEDLFRGMGFEIAEGPEVETTYYNFTALNTPEGHPARDMQDTFYFADDVLLRTQTSSVQIRVMENKRPPIRIIAPGRVYRKDEVDATHSPMFHQIEGLVVDKGITMGDLKGTLDALFKQLYGPQSKTRFRPHHFPFTEPSAEMDLMCFACHGEGCRVCKGEGWIEMLGCGMVHPKVLEYCNIDPEVYTGFAFGLGTDRMAMMRYKVNDLRLFFENDMRFLSQF